MEAFRETVSGVPPSDDEVLRTHDFVPISYSNGPGTRAVLWVQGCSLGCPECVNPRARSPRGGVMMRVDQILDEILAVGDSIEGITISGGEPFEQPVPLARLLREVRANTSLSVVLFTGYGWKQVTGEAQLRAVLGYADVAIAGPYEPRYCVARGLLGSSNQEIHFLTERYSPADFAAIPEAEIIISPNGEVTLTGIDPSACV